MAKRKRSDEEEPGSKRYRSEPLYAPDVRQCQLIESKRVTYQLLNALPADTNSQLRSMFKFFMQEYDAKQLETCYSMDVRPGGAAIHFVPTFLLPYDPDSDAHDGATHYISEEQEAKANRPLTCLIAQVYLAAIGVVLHEGDLVQFRE